MGNLCCKIKEPDETTSYASAPTVPPPVADDISDIELRTALKNVDVQEVDELVMESLNVAASRVDINDETPVPLVQLHGIAEADAGWVQMIISIVTNIPLESPFGPTAISIILDDCPLPSRHTVIEVTKLYRMSKKRASAKVLDLQTDRNLCIVYGCLAEKLIGPNCAAIFTKDTLEYLYTFLKVRQDPRIVLYALIALLKFGYTTTNKLDILKMINQDKINPILSMEKLMNSNHYTWRQVGFCCNWALDNMFVVEGRELTYLKTDNSRINAMLNTEDVSEYLLIRSDGLEARCDSYTFESFRCTFQVDEGCWYYEALIVTPGVMQIGWATKNSYFQNDEGFGIGDDNFSVSYDGCRKLVWFCAKPLPVNNIRAWVPGDILGCLIDVKKREVLFTLNGLRVTSCRQIFESSKYGFYAAASFMAYQQCRFNFGHEPFKFPPKDRKFNKFNDYGVLSDDERVIIPRRIILQQRRCSSVKDNACTLCFDDEATCILDPCGHRGFCSACSTQLRDCPLCRADIKSVKRVTI